MSPEVEPTSFAYVSAGGGLAPAPSPEAADVLWLDLVCPAPATLAAVGARVGAELPTLDDMLEIETSSRLYVENGVAFMTATAPFGMDGPEPQLAPVTFVVAPDQLITIRHQRHKAFEAFPARARFLTFGCNTSFGVTLGLVDAITDRVADLLERSARDIDALGRTIFRPGADPQAKSRDFQRLLEAIGREGDLVSKLRESLASLERLISFLGALSPERSAAKDERAFVKSLGRDARSLIEHTEFLGQKITLLLDAALGMINIEQSNIIKIVSVVAVVFLPPTLIASIYGMNFQAMPELDWILGYPFAIGMMIVFAIVPYLFFKFRGWL